MVAAEFWALLTLGTQFVGNVNEKIEQVKQIWLFLNLFPEWFAHHKQLNENVETLKRKQDLLNSVKHDHLETLETEELRSRKKRRREVETWLKDVERTRRDVKEIEQKAKDSKHLIRLMLENSVQTSLKQVDELLEQREFPNGLTLDTFQAKTPLLTQALFGRDSTLGTIMDWLDDPNVSRIGVYGQKGIGKTAVLTHIQSRVSNTDSAFDHVYWVALNDQPSVQTVQNAVAKQVGLSLEDDEETMIREAKLHEALTKRGKCVIILDGVSKLLLDQVGVRKQAKGCKLVVSTSTLRHCKRMECDREVEIKPLGGEESVKLFMEKLSLRDRVGLGEEIEEIALSIVRECRGLPRLLVNGAERLRGVYDIDEWRDCLTEMRPFRKGIAN